VTNLLDENELSRKALLNASNCE